MSPDLGRFLQPDPIGFKGDSSNLYRYCGNDWANRTDPMGTDGPLNTCLNTRWQELKVRQDEIEVRKSAEPVQRIQLRNPVEDMKGFTMGGSSQGHRGDAMADSIKGDYATARKAFAGQPEVSGLFARTDDPRVTLERSDSFANSREDVHGVQQGKTIEVTASWNPRAALKTSDGRAQSPATALVHILDHVDRILTAGAKAYNADQRYPDHKFGNREDRRVITGLERTAAQFRHEGVRSDGGGFYFPVQSVLDNGER